MASTTTLEVHELSSVHLPPAESPSPTADGSSIEAPGGRQEFSLPPADGGKDAWFFLAAAFVMEGLTWGKLTRIVLWHLEITFNHDALHLDFSHIDI